MNGLIANNNRFSGNGDQALTQPAQPAPTPAPAAQKLTDRQQEVMDGIQHKANIIRDVAFPAAMAAAIPVSHEVGPASFKVYLDGLRKDAGNPTDPVEIMLVEQLALAHHRVAQLHVQAEQSKTIDEAKVFTVAAARLTGELRRLALALNQYRQPVPKRSFTLIKQQNLSRAGQQVAYLDRANENQAQVPFDDRAAKLTNTEALRIGVEPATQNTKPEERNELRPQDDPLHAASKHSS